MRILFAGGGTGGHVYPIIAVLRALKKQLQHDTEFYFLGPKTRGIEQLISEGVRVTTVPAGKIPRYRTPKLLWELLKIPAGVVLAIIGMWRIMPDVVFGKGGYGMLPGLCAAWLFRIPVVIHESDVVLGLSSKIGVRFAKAIAVSFEETKKDLKGAVVSGNPVRITLLNGNRLRAQKRWGLTMGNVVLILGGSLGAWELNETTLAAAPQLLKRAEVILQCGEKTYRTLQTQTQVLQPEIPQLTSLLHIEPFLDEEALADAYAVATLVVSRAGASVLFENALTAKPALLIPLASAAANHQEENALVFSHTGAAEVLSAANLTPNLFATKILDLLADKQKLSVMSETARKFARPQAADAVADLIIKTEHQYRRT